jgi:hypothetical protein
LTVVLGVSWEDDGAAETLPRLATESPLVDLASTLKLLSIAIWFVLSSARIMAPVSVSFDLEVEAWGSGGGAEVVIT